MGSLVAMPTPTWTTDSGSWQRRTGRWVLRVGPPVGGRRGWMVLLDGQARGCGHASSLVQAMACAELERRWLAATDEPDPSGGAQRRRHHIRAGHQRRPRPLPRAAAPTPVS